MKYFAASYLFTIFATSQAAGNLRGGRGEPDSRTYAFRVTVFDDLIRSSNGEFSTVHHIMSIPIVNGVESPELYDIELPEAFVAEHLDLISTGELFIEVEGASIDVKAVTLANDAVISVMDERPLARRQLQNQVDERRIAALRVSMAGGTANTRQVVYTKEKIQHQLFDRPDISLKAQYENCSNGAIKIIPGGVYDVTVPGTFTDFSAPAELRNEALSLFAKQLGLNSANERFDHVIVILPPNEYPGFVGNAGVNHWISTLNNQWSLDVMVYMHEIGHNLGLGHAILSNNAGDYSSYMSATSWKPNLEGPAKCFNAASNKQLQWYKKTNREVDLDLSKDPAQMVTLAAFSEAKSTTSPLLIDVGPYSLQYNLATGFNAGTELLRNEVTVSWTQSDGKTVVNEKGLVPGGNMFTGTMNGKTLRIAACEKLGKNMKIAITLGTNGSPCDIATSSPPAPVPTPPVPSPPAPTQPAPTQPAPVPVPPTPVVPSPISPANICSDLAKRPCKKSGACSWNGSKCIIKSAAPPTPSAPSPSNVCSGLAQRKCKRNNACSWDGKCFPNSNIDVPTVPSSDVCPGLVKRKCKRNVACSWDGIACSANAPRPDAAGLPPSDAGKCSGLKNRKCRKTTGCRLSGGDCVEDIFA